MEIKTALASVIKDYGKDILHDKQRVYGLIADLCPGSEFEKERFLIKNILDLGIGEKIITREPSKLEFDQMINQLISKRAVSHDSAYEALSCFLSIFGYKVQSNNTLSKKKNISERKNEEPQIQNVVLIALILFFVFYFLNTSSPIPYKPPKEVAQTPDKSSKEIKGIDISNDLNRLVKIASLYSLAKKELEVNLISLKEAEDHNNTLTMTHLEIIVNKNRQEQKQYKQKLMAILLEMSTWYKEQPNATTFQFNKAIAEAEHMESIEKVRILKSELKIIEGMPDEKDKLQDYMKHAVENQI